MDTKNALLIPALALASCAALVPPPVYAGPPEGTARVKLGARARPARVGVGPFVLFQTPAASAAPHEAAKAAKAHNPPPPAKDESPALTVLLQSIVPPPITVAVRPNPLVKGSYVAVLTAPGPLGAAQVTEAVEKAQAAVGNSVFVVSNIPPPAPERLAAPDAPAPPVTLTYTLRFLRGPLPASDGTAAGDSEIDPFGADKAATSVADFLGKIYPGGDTTVTAHENRLVFVGPAAHVNALRQMLALSLDVPSPQVKADVYTIQVNTTPRNRDAAQDKVEEIAVGVQTVRDLIHGSEGVLGAYLASGRAKVEAAPGEDPSTLKQRLFADMKRAGYNPSPRRPLSLTDMLILLAPSDREQFLFDLTPQKSDRAGDDRNKSRTEAEKLADVRTPYLVNKLEDELFKVRRQVESGDVPLTSARYSAGDAKAYSRHGKGLVKLIDRIETKVMLSRRDHTPIFARLAGVYGAPAGGDMQGMIDFLDAWHACQGAFLAPSSAPQDGSPVSPREYPDWLSSKSAATDLLLKEAMDALTADLQDVYFQPLLDWIREDVRGAHASDSGIDLVGTTSITVRDRMLVQTQGTADAYFKFTPIPRLTLDALTGAKTPAGGGAAAPTPLQALALQAALGEDAVAPSFRKIAPGTSLAIRPFVLPDGGSARVQMSLTSTVDSAAPDTTRRDVPYEVITNHTVTTEATISAFDLETVASFGVQTTALGDYAWRIPLLDQIPLLGAVFHGPRTPETKQQDSIAIVNLTILPRSLDLVPYYVDADAVQAARAAAEAKAKASQ